ncbi:MAG TPA: M13 family metallopeptidase [Nevskiaceae bacterium]|nr:M13 family metallopeptidase [Nevskiaceae bacterium]
MKRFAVVALLLTACAASNQRNVLPPPPEPSVQPGDDFFAYVNREWLERTEIPADRSGWGSFSEVAEQNDARLHELIESLGPKLAANSATRQVADYYAAFMDERGIESKGIAPIKKMLARIDAIRDRAALTRALGESLRVDVDPLNAGNFTTDNLFGLWIAQGLTEPDHYMPYVLQGGLGMPDRAYYLDASERMTKLREAYQAHVAKMLSLAGYKKADARAARVLELEKKIAQAHATLEESQDVLKANNVWTLADFRKKAPGVDWKLLLKSAGLGAQKKFIVWQPGAVTGEAALVASTDLATWKDWLAYHRLAHFAEVLPKAFDQEQFAFDGHTLSGTPEQPVRWKLGVRATSRDLDDALGKLYVARYFPPEYKERIQKMVRNITAAFAKRVDRLDWMDPSTRANAKAKLEALYVGVGYPERWKSYDGLKIARDDALGNRMRAEKFRDRHELAKLGRKVDRTDWAMPAQLVNAVNLPLQIALNFPAAIMAPPFFDANGSDARNYGAIGAVIGHEISHSFDDQGAQFDARGKLHDWWTPEDREHFQRAAAALVVQYGAYQPVPDLAINGQQTLSENLADLAGVSACYDAYRAAESSPTLASDREFFVGFAQVWRSKYREPALRRALLTDAHSPAPWRAYEVRNLDAWYPAFDVKPGQKLFLMPNERVRVW